jgi:iron complex transport system substrate-binding protein
MKIKTYGIFIVLLIFIMAVTTTTGCTVKQGEPVSSRNITDMLGRTLEIPADIDAVLGTSPPTTMIIYTLAPDKLLGWNFQITGEEASYIPDQYQKLPVTGGWFGKQTGNYENFISMNPDVIFEGFNVQGDANSTLNERQQKFGDIPVVGIEDTVDALSYDGPIRFMGEVLGAEEQAEKLISFYIDVLNDVTSEVAKIPEIEKKTVYYAEGPEGLQTDPAGSQHSQLIDICGGINIADCAISGAYGRTEVSIEEVLKWNPEIIIAGDAVFYEKVFTDPQWQNITAVINHEVYVPPLVPFPWFDRPPSMNRIIGIPWTAQVLYPERFKDLDIESKAKEFYSTFYHYELNDQELSSLLNP